MPLPGKPPLHAGLALLLAVAAALFEPLFLDASILSIDNRVFPPMCVAAGKSPRPMNVLTTDINSYVLPDTLVGLEHLRAGHLPLWNDRQLLGQPLFAAMGFTPAYPTAVLFAVLPPLRALALTLALHLWLLGFGTCRFLTRTGLAPLPALLGAAAAMFAGFVTNHWHMPGFAMAFAWLPWLLMAADDLLTADHPPRRAIASAALRVGLCLLAGGPQIAAIALLATGAWFVSLWWPSRRLRDLGRGLAALCLGGAISAVLLLPATAAWSASARAATPPPGQHLELPALAGFVLPRLFGDPVQEIPADRLVARPLESFPAMRAWLAPGAENNVVENATWFGVLAFALACFGLRRALRPGYRFPAALFVTSLLVALGVPGLADLFALLPGVSVGGPRRVLCVTAFAGAWLAARAVDDAARDGPPLPRLAAIPLLALTALGFAPFETWLFPAADAADQQWFRGVVAGDLALVAAAGVALAAAAALGHARRRAAAGLLALCVAGEGMLLARAFNPPQPLRHQYDTTPVVDWLNARAAGGRLVSFDDTTALPANTAAMFGLRSCTAYLPLADRATHELFGALEPDIVRAPRTFAAVTHPATLGSPLLDLFGVRFVVTSVQGFNRLGERPPHGLRRVYADAAERIAVYERPAPLAPAFLVRRVAPVPDRAARLAALAAPDFAPAEVAYLEHPVAFDGPLGQGSVGYRRHAADRIEVRVVADRPGFLVVSETFADGWRATLDGAPCDIHRADHALMGVAVPAGEHRLELTYRPASFTAGALLSALGLLGCAVLALRRRQSARPAMPSHTSNPASDSRIGQTTDGPS